MARKTMKGRSASGPPFVQLFHYMLQTDAWRTLTPQDRAVYVTLAATFNGSNNGYLGLSVRVAADECNINKDTAAICFRRLQERGFIEQTQEANGYLKAGAFAPEWRLTTHRCDRTGKAPSKAFKSYQPNADERDRKARREKARQKRQQDRHEKISRSQMRGQGVPYEGTGHDPEAPSVRNEGTETARPESGPVRNGGTHIHLAIGSEPEGLPCCISDDARGARPPKGAVASERRRGSRPTTFPN